MKTGGQGAKRRETEKESSETFERPVGLFVSPVGQLVPPWGTKGVYYILEGT
ncbi:MAG TPA: hypothetical protein VJ805_11065 [Nitrospiraceae bacterium]|nr:hypothetical protein [Nitrospiraceae bacterium]